jgi:DNA-binding response OmpR family regulator
MNKEKILIVDDEVGLIKLLEVTLTKERFSRITSCVNGKDTLLKVQAEEFDLILLDVMLPDMDGFEVCREIRKYSEAPIIFISSCSSDFDKLTGLGAGGDDYITKPFNPLEVVARVKAIFRRKKMYEARSIQKSSQTTLTYGNILLTPSEARLVVEEREVECTAKEMDLLTFFLQHPNQVFSSGELYERVWGEDVFGEEKTVTIYISRIRKKIGDNTRNPFLIVNLRGIGYKFVPPIPCP